jgi:hypothetical protein
MSKTAHINGSIFPRYALLHGKKSLKAPSNIIDKVHALLVKARKSKATHVTGRGGL